MILGFFELPREEQPPERIWRHPELIETHFETVRSRREANSRGMEPIDYDDGPSELQNPVTAKLRR